MTTAESYYVVDSDDRIVQVAGELHATLDRFIGHTIWECSPEAEPILGPSFAEARRTGQEVEITVYYAGELAARRIVPSGETLAVHVTPLAELDVRTLGTLARSLRQIEEELAGRERARPDRPAPESLRALP